ncbi:type II toxin-antitoxin system VapC family toxin [Anaerolineales bacterium HSG25]|nr:type II toxin-antitoxin system VapC family toxin [Anaerolineales bacterium HSG25]
MSSNKKGRWLYWDTNVFLAYFNAERDRVDVIEDLWDEIKNEDGQIVTSVSAIVETAFIKQELPNAIDPTVEKLMDDVWHSIMIIEDSYPVAIEARTLIRTALKERNWKLKPKDALHLASAKWVNRHVRTLNEFHTYDSALEKYATLIGLPINKPYVLQQRIAELR